MQTNREIIYKFRNLFEADGFTSDDLAMSDLAVLHELFSSRAVIVKDRTSKGDLLPQQMFQTIPCIDLEVVDRNDCPTATASGCVWLRSKKPIPEPLITLSITTRLGGIKATYTPWDRVGSKLNSRVASNRSAVYYTYKDTEDGSYLYIYNTEELALVQLTAVFFNPIEAAAYCGTNTKAVCNPLDLPFYTTGKYLDPVEKLAITKVIELKALGNRDQLNNDKKD